MAKISQQSGLWCLDSTLFMPLSHNVYVLPEFFGAILAGFAELECKETRTYSSISEHDSSQNTNTDSEECNKIYLFYT